MPDVVDKMGMPQSTPPASTPAATDGAETPERARESRGRDAAARIQQLVERAKDAEHALSRREQEFTSEIADLRKQLEELKTGNGHGGNRPVANPTGWHEVSLDEVERIVDAGPDPDNPKGYGMAVRELQRRMKESAIQDASKATQAHFEQEAQLRQAYSDMAAKFGADVFDPKTELNQRAVAYLQAEMRRRGPGVERDPDTNMKCAALAFRDLHANDHDELQNLRRENEALKRAQAMEPGVKGATRLSEDTQDLLKKAGASKGGIKAALKSLDIVRGLTE